MAYLAEHEDNYVASAKEVSQNKEMSLKFLQSVIADLVKSNIVTSISGAKGGNKLNMLPSCITVLQVIESVEGKIAIMDCMESSESCNEFEGCQIHCILGKALFAMNEVLEKHTVADLVETPVSQ